MVEAIQRFFTETFGNPAIVTILIAMVPIAELKVAIPFAVLHYKLSIWEALLWGIVGTSIMIVVYLLLLIPIINALKKTKWFGRFAAWVERIFTKRSKKVSDEAEAKAGAAEATRAADGNGVIRSESAAAETDGKEDEKKEKHEKAVRWYKTAAVFTWVAIPIPGTGVLTGSALAAFSKLSFKRSFLAVFAGNILAGVIVALISGLF